MRRIGRVGLALAVALPIAACTSPSPSLIPRATPLPSNPDGIPAGVLIRIDQGVEMSDDNRTITIRFIGGAYIEPNEPCYTGYIGWARLVGEELELAVLQVTEAPPPPGEVCGAAGMDREVQVVLDAPFLGTTATDVSDGHDLEIQRTE